MGKFVFSIHLGTSVLRERIHWVLSLFSQTSVHLFIYLHTHPFADLDLKNFLNDFQYTSKLHNILKQGLL